MADQSASESGADGRSAVSSPAAGASASKYVHLDSFTVDIGRLQAKNVQLRRQTTEVYAFMAISFIATDISAQCLTFLEGAVIRIASYCLAIQIHILHAVSSS